MQPVPIRLVGIKYAGSEPVTGLKSFNVTGWLVCQNTISLFLELTEGDRPGVGLCLGIPKY
jgi:hypothetical protein